MNPRQFLLLGGIVLLLLAALGFTIMGTPESSPLHEAFYLDMGENVAHLLFGVVALGAYFGLKDEKLVRYLVILVGVVALLVAVLGFLSSGKPMSNVGIANLENPLDNILHLVVAVWAFAVAFMKPKMGGGTNTPTTGTTPGM